MPEVIFSAKSLTKQYKKKNSKKIFNALDNFNMEIHQGDIYGFVGKNGAGKTTLMRILTGRFRQSSGDISLFGESDGDDYCKQLGRVGALIETPAVFPGMTAWDNLKVLRLQYGITGMDCISEALEVVGLQDAGAKKVKDFSFGMKQRLGLAQAIMGEREFLVLDEPTNGLDPEGIIEFRTIIKKLNKEKGVTILISSHMLNELSQLVTCYGFIRAGKMVREISASKIENVNIEEFYLSSMRGNKR